MKDTYVQAVLELLTAGESVETVLANLKKVLATRGHQKLHAQILTSLATKLQLEVSANMPKVVMAHKDSVSEAEVKNALAELSAPEGEYKTTYNPNLIGGLIATYKSKQLDQSYQTKLRELYQSIITA